MLISLRILSHNIINILETNLYPNNSFVIWIFPVIFPSFTCKFHKHLWLFSLFFCNRLSSSAGKWKCILLCTRQASHASTSVCLPFLPYPSPFDLPQLKACLQFFPSWRLSGVEIGAQRGFPTRIPFPVACLFKLASLWQFIYTAVRLSVRLAACSFVCYFGVLSRNLLIAVKKINFGRWVHSKTKSAYKKLVRIYIDYLARLRHTL